MKIAVTYENEQIFQHFGQTTQFKVYSVAGGRIVSAEVIDTDGQGHGALAGLLKLIGADVLICGGTGCTSSGSIESSFRQPSSSTFL